jgi:thiamine-phosphate pyrophosphorylase
MKHALHLLTDDSNIFESNYWPIITEAVEAGIDVLQLRFKLKNKKAFYEMAKNLKPFLSQKKVLFLINDHIDIANAVDADGVHLGQDDLPISVARKLLGSKKIVGLSIPSLSHLHTAIKTDADYLGVGPIFKSNTKKTPHMGVKALSDITRAIHIPCIAIGGIDETNTTEVIKAGAVGIAVSHAIICSSSPFDSTKGLRKLL